MDNDAAAAAPQAPEGAPSTTNPEPATPPQAPAEAPAITAEQVAQFLGTTPEKIGEFTRFTEANGKFDKVFTNMKQAISGRQADAQPQVQAPQQPAELPQQPQQPAQPQVQGGFSTQEFITQQYFESLANRDAYANIADDIRSGAVIKEMAKFGINPLLGDQFNNKQVTDFLDLYSKTRPAVTPSTPITTTPTVEYVNNGETITNMNQAMAILQQDQQLRAQGKEGHPMAAEANKFFDQTLTANQNRGKTEHTTLAEAQAKAKNQ